MRTLTSRNNLHHYNKEIFNSHLPGQNRSQVLKITKKTTHTQKTLLSACSILRCFYINLNVTKVCLWRLQVNHKLFFSGMLKSNKPRILCSLQFSQTEFPHRHLCTYWTYSVEIIMFTDIVYSYLWKSFLNRYIHPIAQFVLKVVRAVMSNKLC